MLLGTDRRLPVIVGTLLTNSISNDFVISAILNPRFFTVMDASDGYSERLISIDISRLIQFHHIDMDNDTENLNENTMENVEDIRAEMDLSDAWVDKISNYTPTRIHRGREQRTLVRNEIASYRSNVTGR